MPVGSGRRIWCSSRPARSPTAAASAAWASVGLRTPTSGRGRRPRRPTMSTAAPHQLERRASSSLVAVVGVDDELDAPRVVAPRDLGVGDRACRRPVSRATRPAKPVPAAVDEVEPLVVRQRLLAVGALGRRRGAVDDLGDVVGAIVPLDLEAGHGGEATHGARPSRNLRRDGTTANPEGPGQARWCGGWPTSTRARPGSCARSTTTTPSSCWRPRSCRPRRPTCG